MRSRSTERRPGSSRTSAARGTHRGGTSPARLRARARCQARSASRRRRLARSTSLRPRRDSCGTRTARRRGSTGTSAPAWWRRARHRCTGRPCGREGHETRSSSDVRPVPQPPSTTGMRGPPLAAPSSAVSTRRSRTDAPESSLSRSSSRRHVDAEAASRVDCFRITRVRVAHDPDPGVARQHALQFSSASRDPSATTTIPAWRE